MLKKFLPFTLTFALCGLLLTGCEEDVVSGNEPSMTAEVDGDDWETSSVTVTEAGSSLVITAAATDGTAILLTLPSDAAVGTHEIGMNVMAAYRPNSQTSMAATSGEITISAISASEISGSFEFDATDGSTTVEIDDGSFYAKRN